MAQTIRGSDRATVMRTAYAERMRAEADAVYQAAIARFPDDDPEQALRRAIDLYIPSSRDES